MTRHSYEKESLVGERERKLPPTRRGSMERAGEDDDAGSGSRRRSMGASAAEATSTMAVKQHQALRLAEDLSLPSVQVVVMSANMGCSHCRQRVTKVVTKMNGLLDYMVDFGKKEVTVRGTVIHTKKKKKRKTQPYMITGLEKVPPANVGARTLSWFLGCYGS